VCLAAPLDCLSMSNALSSRLVGRLMDPLLVRLVQDVKESHRSVLAMHPGVHLPTVDAARTMAEFDGAAIAPMMGEPSASQYYRSASAGRLLHRIATPTLIIHATNDPIVSAQSSLYELVRVPWKPTAIFAQVTSQSVRLDDILANPFLLHLMVPAGGHSMDWPTGLRMNRAWSADVVREFMLAIQDHSGSIAHLTLKSLNITEKT
jgi:pimeloyl-ACP methyl ester carboxylesterase